MTPLQPWSPPLRLLVGLALASCTGPTGALLLPPDPARDGGDGDLGPWGVLHHTADIAVSPTESRQLLLYLPVDEQTRVLQDRALVTLLPGGFVEPSRYEWLATHVASQGFVTVITQHRLDAALLEPDVPARARTWLLDHPEYGDALLPEAPTLAIGHSLGGVAAARWWSESPDIVVGLGLLASYPAASTPIEDAPPRPVVAISGDRDGLTSPSEISDTLDRFPSSAQFTVIEGMNHFQWTDRVKPSEARRDDDPTRGLAAVRRDAMRALGDLLRVVQASDADLDDTDIDSDTDVSPAPQAAP